MTTEDPRHTPLAGKDVVLGVSGGIAAYKAAELVRLLVKAGAQVHCVMTDGAREFITPLTLQTLSGRPVATLLFDLTQESEIGHIRLADRAALVIVAPATADLIGRYAGGLANDLLATVLLATRAPVLLAPAMNVNMWEHPLVQGNLARLVATGRTHVIGPGSGFLACRWVGPGRMVEPVDIVEQAGRLLLEHDLAGRHVLVSAGPTHEPLDPVRYLGNRSSGKMGYAIARAAVSRGAQVTLVSGPTALEAPLGVTLVPVTTARELEAAMRALLGEVDAVIMSAAVADFAPAEPATRKLKKEALGARPSIALQQSPDVLAGLAKARRGGRPVLVGFAAETEDVEARARGKLVQKGVDLVVGNDVSGSDAGFETETNRAVLVGPGDARVAIPLMHKGSLAHRILDSVRGLLGEGD